MALGLSSILSPNVHPAERWLSVIGGSLLSIHGWRRGRTGTWETIAGAMMIKRGITGKCEVYQALGLRTAPHNGALPYELGVHVRSAITINQPRDKVFQFWRQLDNLPRFMQHVVSVQMNENNRSHWIVEGPAGRHYEWDAETIQEVPNEVLAWKSLPGSDVDSAGSVRFHDAPGERGTEIVVKLQYIPPAGHVGALAAKIFGREPGQEVARDLRRLKQFLETGEVATTDGQPKGEAAGVTVAVAQTLEEVLT